LLAAAAQHENQFIQSRATTMNTPIRPIPRLTLHSVRLRLLSAPLRRPIVSNPTVGRYAEWPFILIDLQTNEGIVGNSYLEPYVAGSASYILPAIEAIAATLKSRPLAPIDCFASAMKAVHLSGKEGVGLVAASGLDMAIWDAVAKSAGMPLAEYLGASTGTVRAYNTNGLWLVPPAQLREEAISLVEEGNFSAIKMRMGREKFSADVEALNAVRSAVGGDIRIMVDFNQALDMGEALLRLHALDSEGLQWFEEPIAFDNFAGCSRLARELKTPIQIGENSYGPRSFYRAIQENAADLYMPDMMRIGGITGFLRCAAIAGAAGIPLSSHLYPEASAHVLRVAETAHWLEWRDWAHPFLAEPFVVENGHVVIPDRPGLGISWNESAVSKFLVR
jgi:mandelate racemase